MGKMSREKGASGERELAKLFREHGFDEARRGVQYRGGPDSPDAIGLPGCHVECKRVERLELHAAIAQAQRDAAEGATPIVFHRRNRGEWIAILPASAFLEILHLAEYGHPAGEPIVVRNGG